MDALSMLKKEIASKKRSLEETQVLIGERRFFKRADLNAKLAEDYWRRHGNEKPAVIPIIQESAESSNCAMNDASIECQPELPRGEVVRRLREREEPVLLYGESELDAFRRLRRLEIVEPEINRGLRNDFQEAMERVDQAYLNEVLKNEELDATREVTSSTGEALTMDGLKELASGLTCENIEAGSVVVLQFVQLMLQVWGAKLNSLPEAEKMSVRGKMDAATYSQTQGYLKPLIKRLKKRSMPEDIMESLIEIVLYCLERDYVKANDAYLQMSIGNAPWPIGVTMVGIHARTGREKIYSKHVAHVLNDETQRKYIQGLKRLMTKCQSYFTAMPSKCVEYNALQ